MTTAAADFCTRQLFPWGNITPKHPRQEQIVAKYFSMRTEVLARQVKARGGHTLKDMGLGWCWSFAPQAACIDDGKHRTLRLEVPFFDFISLMQWKRWEMVAVLTALDLGYQPQPKQ
jgi:hypothetical protein